MSEIKKKILGRPRSVRSHQAMLSAALELLGEVGFEAMSIDAIAARAGVGKTTIYRRYTGKEELVADAIESIREEILIPDAGNFERDLDAIIQNAAQVVLSPVGKHSVAMIISSATSNPKFAQIYWTNYLEPRRKTFAIVLERAQARNEISGDLDPGLFFDAMSGIMLYGSIFQPNSEAWLFYVRRALNLLVYGASSK